MVDRWRQFLFASSHLNFNGFLINIGRENKKISIVKGKAKIGRKI